MKNRRIRFLTVLLILMMLTFVLFTTASAAQETTAQEPAAQQTALSDFKYNGLFSYASGDDADYSAACFYDDNYFNTSSFVYQDSLATMSLCLAMSAFASNEADYASQSKNLEQLLADCGFAAEHYATNDWFTCKPAMDSVAVGASYKELQTASGPYTLIAVAIRGAGYESEWSSNFTIGESGQHQGFREAKEEVLRYLTEEYIPEQNITGKVKVWLTGYSRAAVTANLVGAELDAGYALGDGVELNSEDLYTYCFEPPQGALLASGVEAAEYANIFSIVNRNDITTKVAPKQPAAFGFAGYGVHFYLPTALTSVDYAALREAMLEKYNALESTTEYIVDDFQMQKVNPLALAGPTAGSEQPLIVAAENNNQDQSTFLNETFWKISVENFKSRTNYVELYEDEMRLLAKVLFGSSPGKEAELQQNLFGNLQQEAQRILSCVDADDAAELSLLIEKNVTKAFEAVGTGNYDAAAVKSFAGNVTELLLSFGTRHPDLLVTVISNLDNIAAAHDAGLCLAWLQSFDVNYTSAAVDSFDCGAYRLLRVNCPVNISVYDDSNGVLAAAIIDDQPQNVAGSTIIASVNAVGEKIFYLPAAQDYLVKLEATAAGSMSYAVNEYAEAAGGYTRLVNFRTVSFEQGAFYNGLIPAADAAALQSGLAGGSSVKYQLQTAAGKDVAVQDDLTGQDAASAYYFVNAAANNSDYGVVMGSDVVFLGAYAQLTALPRDGYDFVGWYAGDKLLSEARQYRFQVMSDVDIVGMFVPQEDEELPTQEIVVKDSFTKYYGSRDFYLRARNTSEGAAALSYQSSDESVVVVSAQGRVSIKGVGTATVTVTAPEVAGKYAETSEDVTVTIKQSKLQPENNPQSNPEQKTRIYSQVKDFLLRLLGMSD